MRLGIRTLVVVAIAILILVLWEGIAFSAEESKRGAFAWELGGAGPNARATPATPPASKAPEAAPVAAPAPMPAVTPLLATPAAAARPLMPSAPTPTFGEWLQQLIAEDQNRSAATNPATSPPAGGSPSDGPATGPTAPADSVSNRATAPSPEPRNPNTAAQTPQPAPAQGPPPRPRPDGASTATQPAIAPPEILGVQTAPSGWDQDPANQRRLAELSDEALSFTSTLDLIIALEAEFQNLPGDEVREEPAILRSDLYHRIIELSVQVGFTDNPRDNLDAIRTYLRSSLRVEAVLPTQPDLDLIRAAKILRAHRASDVGWALLALCFAERLNSYLDLEAIEAGGLLALRYRSGAHRYVLAPLQPEKLLTEQEFLTLARGTQAGVDEIRLLTRKQFWGRVFGDVGAALLEREGEVAHAAQWLDRGLNLFREQPFAHIAQARILTQRNDLPSALEALDRAVTIDRHNAPARLQRAEVLTMLGEDDRLIEDLRWLSHDGKNARSALQLVRLLLRHSEFVAARKEVERLREFELPPSLAADFAMAEKEVAATPWVEVLMTAKQDAERFEAVDRLRSHAIPLVHRALADTLDDNNLRLAQYAARTLREMTGLELPPIRDRWLSALGLQTK